MKIFASDINFRLGYGHS